MNNRAISSSKKNSRSQTASLMRKVIMSAASLLMFWSMQQQAFAADAAAGLQLFKANCQRCHSPNLKLASTGPALYGVADRIPEGDWIYQWVKNSNKLIGEGDAYAVKVWKDNNKAAMDPMPHLENENIDDIMAWITAWQPAADAVDGGSGGIDPNDDAGLSSLWNWVRLLIFVLVVVLVNIAIQIARLRGIEFMAGINLDKFNARMMLGFYVFGMIGAVWSVGLYKHFFIQSNSASDHGIEIDNMFWISMVIVFGVFVIVNGLLFWFAYRYGKDGDRQARYFPENHKLELIWTVVPAIVLAVLIIFGIKTWTSVMSAPDEGEELMKIEVSGQQWGWILRYPGDNDQFGDIDVHRIGGDNILGVDYIGNDGIGKDDFVTEDMVLCKGVRADLKIRSRDVLHSVYLPHFRVKMDAVPGMDTRFHFMPNQTTEEYRLSLKDNPYWGGFSHIDTTAYTAGEKIRYGSNVGTVLTQDSTVVDSAWLWQTFDFELACTEVCGRGHFSMRKKVVVMEKEDWEVWYNESKKTPMYQAGDYNEEEEYPTLSDGQSAGQPLEKPILE